MENIDLIKIGSLTYKPVASGTWFDTRTPERLIATLEQLRVDRRRVVVTYVTGDHDSGRVGRSTGIVKCPLIVHNARSMGGQAILCDAVEEIRLSSEPHTVLYRKS
jgi:hypothetical protein